MNNLILSAILCLASAAAAQGPMAPGPGPAGPDRPPMERAFHDHHFGRWWNDPQLARQLNLTDDQKHRMDDIFLQHRLRLIDLEANLQKQEVQLRPMIEADQPSEGKVLSQIDAIAQARAELEKANARMLFDIRKTLTGDQWKKLKALREEHRPGDMRPGPGDRADGEGRGEWRRRRNGPPVAPGPSGPSVPSGPEGAGPAPDTGSGPPPAAPPGGQPQ